MQRSRLLRALVRHLMQLARHLMLQRLRVLARLLRILAQHLMLLLVLLWVFPPPPIGGLLMRPVQCELVQAHVDLHHLQLCFLHQFRRSLPRIQLFVIHCRRERPLLQQLGLQLVTSFQTNSISF
jgi:hypothetical protein